MGKIIARQDSRELVPDALLVSDRFTIPKAYAGKTIWLNFEGVNYASQVWVNGKNIGATKGAFVRSVFDISSVAIPGKEAVLAVLVSPQPHPGNPHEHTLANGMGPNGGVSAMDGPTFLYAMGWDWIPAIRDRDTGIWQKVFLSATGSGRSQRPADNHRCATAQPGCSRGRHSGDGAKPH